MRESQWHQAADARRVTLRELHDVHALPAIAWKNGGGTTREIACRPAGARLDDFDWRVSVATIAADGAFSAFPGIDRTIALLRGDGVRLQSTDGSAIDHRLDTFFQPFAFDGGQALQATLLGGESTDFNVMTRRSRFRAELRVIRAPCTLKPAARGLVHVAAGEWMLDGDARAYGCGQGCWWDDTAPQELHVMPRDIRGSHAVLLVVDIVATGSAAREGARTCTP
jgi:environmental stress-induced protein Ves